MDRFALNYLSQWAHRTTPKPLILRGARQVGKSTLVRMLCEKEKLELFEVNLEKTKLKELDNEESFSIEKVLREIELHLNRKIHDQGVVFLDEIQTQPRATSRPRYFYEDRPGLKVIAASSLLEAVLEQTSHPMPVGRVEYYYIGPMTFFEFLKAKGEDILIEQIQTISTSSAPSASLHERATELLREFYFVGGMPEAIQTYIATGDEKEVRSVQHSLIQTYRDDIPKYTRHSKGERVQEVFNYVPGHIGEKVKYSAISQAHSNSVREAIDLLAKAGVIYKVTHTSSAGLPLKAGEDPSIFKLYMLDIGIYNALLNVQLRDLFKLPAGELVTRGNMAEQFVAQHLLFRHSQSASPYLHYWLRKGKAQSAEVDFVIEENGQIFPVEVKAGSTGKMRSLWQFVADKQTKNVVRLDLSRREELLSQVMHKLTYKAGKQQEVRCQLLGWPIYAIETLTDALTMMQRD